MRLSSRLFSNYRWHESSIIVVQKSKFKGFCIPIKSENEIEALLIDLKNSDKNIAKATHPTMLAWKTARDADCSASSFSNTDKASKRKSPKNIKDNQSQEHAAIKNIASLNQGINDCGEGGSGDRLMGLLDRCKLVNILVVVTRWYGGTPLGPTRFRCISDAATESLKAGKFLDFKPKNKNAYIDCTKV